MTIPVCNLQLPENSWKINPGFNGNRTLDLPELVQFTVTVFQTLWWVIRDGPNDVQLYFLKVNVYGNTRYSKTGIPDQTGGIYTLFQTKMAKSIPCFRLEMLENDTLWGNPLCQGAAYVIFFMHHFSCYVVICYFYLLQNSSYLMVAHY